MLELFFFCLSEGSYWGVFLPFPVCVCACLASFVTSLEEVGDRINVYHSLAGVSIYG